MLIPLNVRAISAKIVRYTSRSTVTFWILFETSRFSSLLQVTPRLLLKLSSVLEKSNNLKFNFLLQDQLGSLSIPNFFLTVFKMLPRYEYFLVTLFLLRVKCRPESAQKILSCEISTIPLFSLQFICGLSLCCGTQAHLSRDEIQKVVEVYRQPNGRVRYKEFCDIMENG